LAHFSKTLTLIQDHEAINSGKLDFNVEKIKSKQTNNDNNKSTTRQHTYISCQHVCLFVTAARAIFQLSGGCHHYRYKTRPMLSTYAV
jgi:hypothetical protein